MSTPTTKDRELAEQLHAEFNKENQLLPEELRFSNLPTWCQADWIRVAQFVITSREQEREVLKRALDCIISCEPRDAELMQRVEHSKQELTALLKPTNET